MRTSQHLTPWWLSPGTEICSVCHQLYIYETEYRCADCDGPTCENCVEVGELSVTICLPCSDYGGREKVKAAAN